MLKSFLLFTAVVLLVLASASAPARPPQDAATAANAKSGARLSPEAHARAKKIFEQDCALCHGSTGDGKTDLAKDMQLTLLDWTDSKSLSSMSDQALFDAIRKGKGKMPPEEDSRAKNEEVRNLVVYIRKFGKDQPSAAAPATQQPTATPTPAAAPATPPPPTSPSN